MPVNITKKLEIPTLYSLSIEPRSKSLKGTEKVKILSKLVDSFPKEPVKTLKEASEEGVLIDFLRFSLGEYIEQISAYEFRSLVKPETLDGLEYLGVDESFIKEIEERLRKKLGENLEEIIKVDSIEEAHKAAKRVESILDKVEEEDIKAIERLSKRFDIREIIRLVEASKEGLFSISLESAKKLASLSRKDIEDLLLLKEERRRD